MSCLAPPSQAAKTKLLILLMIRNQVKLLPWCWGQEQFGQFLRASHLCLQKFDIDPFRTCSYLCVMGQNLPQHWVLASSRFVENTPSVSLHQCLVVWQFNSVEISVHNNAFQPSQVLAYCSIGLVASILGELAAGVWRVPVDLASRH